MFNNIDLLRYLLLAEFVCINVPIDSMFISEGFTISPKLREISVKGDALIVEMDDYDNSIHDADDMIHMDQFKQMLGDIDTATFTGLEKLFFKVCLYRGDEASVAGITMDELELEEISCESNILYLTTSMCRLL